MVEEGGALHAISHARNGADDKLPERNLDSTCCRQSITGSNSRKQKNNNFRPIPTVIKQYFEQDAKQKSKNYKIHQQ